MVTFGNNLKQLRKRNKLSQKQLAELIGVGQTTIANYENDSRFPNQIILNKLVDALNISYDNLIGRQETKEYGELSTYVDKVLYHLLEGGEKEAIDFIVNMAKKGVDVIDIYYELLTKILYKVGDLWEMGLVSIPMEHHITGIIDQIMVLLSPYIKLNEANGKSAVFMAPSNEPHLVGLKIIKEAFRKYGWKTYFIGNSVPWTSLTSWIKEHDVDLLVISTTMNDNINQVEGLVDFIRNETDAKVMIGGQVYEMKEYLINQVKPDYFLNTKLELLSFLESQ
ncbi:helix-turn-helix domain-containing protein [Acidaminobacter sp. JC074]|uniref:helix-turn-helix domain-containing protein n=1 Tax=Acidaminobacter sp. JC074 TaxID=2530199 RepID=UPI001F10C972|nr:helix-turn-helix domain-containing protein [Acidaminobacter sp. JC074]MCH4886719.1 helix-turn-helix domain-containing protein [Acidaminobacter sp. JC074]